MTRFRPVRVFLRKIHLIFLSRKKVLCLEVSPGLYMYGVNRPGYGLRGAYLYGLSSEPELTTLNRFLAPGDSFIDVGCSTGIYTMLASKLVGKDGMIISLDANSEMTNCLTKSVEHNDLTNVIVLNHGVGSKSEILDFYANSGKPNSYSFRQHDSKATLESIWCDRLDKLVEDLGVKNLKYIKVDVEGFESEVLLGASSLIQKFRPVIQVETIFGMPELKLDKYQVWRILESPNSLLIPEEYIYDTEFKQKIEASGFKLQRRDK